MAKVLDTPMKEAERSGWTPADRQMAFSPVLATRRQMRLGLIGRLLRQQSLRVFLLLAVVEVGMLLMAPLAATEIRFHADPGSRAFALQEMPLTSSVFAGVVWL